MYLYRAVFCSCNAANYRVGVEGSAVVGRGLGRLPDFCTRCGRNLREVWQEKQNQIVVREKRCTKCGYEWSDYNGGWLGQLLGLLRGQEGGLCPACGSEAVPFVRPLRKPNPWKEDAETVRFLFEENDIPPGVTVRELII